MGVCFRLCGVVGVSEGQGIGFAGSPRRGVMVSRSVGVCRGMYNERLRSMVCRRGVCCVVVVVGVFKRVSMAEPCEECKASASTVERNTRGAGWRWWWSGRDWRGCWQATGKETDGMHSTGPSHVSARAISLSSATPVLGCLTMC